MLTADLLHPKFSIPSGPYRDWWRFLLFIRSWTLIFNISTRSSQMLYRILHLMLPQMLAAPKITNHLVDKNLGINGRNDAFEGYVCCPKCHRVTRFDDSWERVRGTDQSVSKRCAGILLKNHKDARHRVCGALLLRTVGSIDGMRQHLVPFLTYAYRPVKTRLSELLNRPGLEDLCERWRHRDVPAGHLGDVYDGSIWREFARVNGRPFFEAKDQANYGMSIFVDWFQPWSRVQYSVGVLFGCLLNLPREERHKKENIFLIGIFPGGTEKNLSLNPLLEPFKDEMLALHPDAGGIPMATYKYPKGRKVCVVCMLAVCDLPAGKKLAGFVGHNGDKGCSRCDKTWAATRDPIDNQVRLDGEGETDEEDEEDEEDDEDDGDGEEKNEGKEEKRGPEIVEPAVARYDEWDELGEEDLSEGSGDDAGDEVGDVKEEKNGDRREELRAAKARVRASQRPRRAGATTVKKVRTWRRVYARPAEMGKARDLVSHRRYAKRWLEASTKSAQLQIAKNHGVKYSVLLELDYWDPIRFTVIDSLHAFWLGICRTLMKQWRDSKWKKGSKAMDTMQRRLNAMRVPPDVCRLLNKWSSNMSGLTGHQIKAFVGCFSLVVYAGFLDHEEEKLWNHLVVASRLLSRQAITLAQVDEVLTPSVTVTGD